MQVSFEHSMQMSMYERGSLVYLPSFWSALELHRPAGFTQHPPDRWSCPPRTGNFNMCKQPGAHVYSTETHAGTLVEVTVCTSVLRVHHTRERVSKCLFNVHAAEFTQKFKADMDRWLCPCRNGGYVLRLTDNEASILNFADQWVIFAVAFLTEPNYLSCNRKKQKL